MAIRRTTYATGKGKSGSSVNVAISGMESFKKSVDDELEKTAQEVADIILQKALPYTPMEKGSLRSTGKAYTKKTKNGWQGRVSFGGVADDGVEVDYAVIVHNDLNPKKKFTTPGTGPLYLTRAVQESWSIIKKISADTITNIINKEGK